MFKPNFDNLFSLKLDIVSQSSRYSVTRCLYYVYNTENSPNRIRYFPNVGSKFCPKLHKPSKNCQSGEISPNLVTLDSCDVSCSKSSWSSSRGDFVRFSRKFSPDFRLFRRLDLFVWKFFEYFQLFSNSGWTRNDSKVGWAQFWDYFFKKRKWASPGLFSFIFGLFK